MVIDDERTLVKPGHDVHHVRTSKDALQVLQSDSPGVQKSWDALYLDHDLGGEDTIRPIVDFLEEKVFFGDPLDIGCIFAHTANPVGADYILKSRLLNSAYSVSRVGLEDFIVP